MKSISKRTCPECGRFVNVRTNRFGDLVFTHHKMAVTSGIRANSQMDKLISSEMAWKPNINASAAPIWEIDCPNSGQVVEMQ